MTTFGLDRVRIEKRGITPLRVELTLPNLPPSTNNLYFNVAGKGRVKSSGYSNWLEYSGLLINSQRPKRITGPVNITFELEDRHPRRDCTNASKPLEDLLVKCGIIPDDNAKHVRSVTTKWADVKGVRITISLAERAA